MIIRTVNLARLAMTALSNRNHLCRSRSYHYFSKVLFNHAKPQPVDSQFTCKSHKLMVYNAIIHQEHAGVYHFLPLGQRAMDKLVALIDSAMTSIDAQKITMPCLISGALWKQSGRWDVLGPELFRLQDRNNTDLCLGPTHEESVTSLIASQSPLSYRALPLLLYQVNTKFRDEMQPKYGLLRGKEFVMKDLYTFDMDEASARTTYSRVCQAYSDLLDKLQLLYTKVEATSGTIGGVLSHEFHLPSDVGEDKLLICTRCGTGYNREVLTSKRECGQDEAAKLGQLYCKTPNCNTLLTDSLGIEVGHTFLLGQIYSSVFNAEYKDSHGESRLMEMGCYGLGVSRILQASIQVLSTDTQIRWPYLLAPYKVCLIPQKEGYKAEEFMRKSHELARILENLPELYSEVLLDDRTDLSVGRRLYEAKRRGFPYIIVINKMALRPTAPLYEFIDITKDDSMSLSADQITDHFISLSQPGLTDVPNKHSL